MFDNKKSIYVVPLLKVIVIEMESVLINESIGGGNDPDDPWDE